jgi:DNA (cytosine-5)-methyltransferase 1
MPDTDLLVYSFPCQDLSTGGLGKGMKKGSGTRSGLLWEIERILKELAGLRRLPEYLLLENVKTIKAKCNQDDLNQWLQFLESM